VTERLVCAHCSLPVRPSPFDKAPSHLFDGNDLVSCWTALGVRCQIIGCKEEKLSSFLATPCDLHAYVSCEDSLYATGITVDDVVADLRALAA
jgi:hypothetical protein